MKQLIVFRFSAMGDVALLTPVVEAMSQQYPDRQLTVVTRQKFSVFFEHIPGIRVFGADFDGRHKGFPGLFRLFRELRQLGSVEAVIDAHQNLRTSVLKAFFRATGVPCFTLNKGRTEKKALTRRENKVRNPLPHSIERYLQTFAEGGYSATIGKPPYFRLPLSAEAEVDSFLKNYSISNICIGIAPFAQHEQKMWPFNRFETVLNELGTAITFFLFGGGKAEIAQLETLQKRFPNAILVAGKLSFTAELALIKHLQLMICMDSGNMHLAALSGVPVLSIWGATHPFAGFGPWAQGQENILQISTDELPCRPCSVFGNKPCWRGDLACLDRITANQVAYRASLLLQKK
ncbi:MAG: glycosyltransferase family 9 protein [Siphonobacter sp.]